MATKKRRTVEMTAEFAAAAIIGLEQKRQELDVKIAELPQIAIGEASASASKTSVAKSKRKRFISPAAREKNGRCTAQAVGGCSGKTSCL